MKPENAIKVEADCDLSGHTIFYAKDKIQKELEPKYENKLYWELRVPSQLMGEAMKLAYLLGLEVSLDFEYYIDEWSLRGYSVGSRKEKTIWSPGA